MARLSDAAVQDALRTLREWRLENGALTRDYTFPDFAAAFAFVTRLALLAERTDHHPDIDIRYNKVRVALLSHDAGGVTERDVKAAGAISAL
jgi:4a-hydroxytetrahydrobiopterin dehydratase